MRRINKMENNSFIRIDLLKQRRKVETLEDVLFTSNKKNLKKGIAIGSSFLIISILICLASYTQAKIYKREIQELETSTFLHDNLQAKIKKGLFEIRLIQKFNKNLANAILGLRSIPEIIYEIGSLVPQDAKLESIKINKNILNINGNSENPLNLDLINTYIIGLKNSPFIKNETVVLVNAKQDEKMKNKNEDLSSENINFNITAEFIEDYPNLNKRRMNKIKSKGLAQRIKMIESEGLTE